MIASIALALFNWARTHKKPALVIAGMIAAFLAGAFTHAKLAPNRAPAIEKRETVATTAASKSETDTLRIDGAKSVVKIEFTPAPQRTAGAAPMPNAPAASTPVFVPGVSAPIAVPDGEMIASVTIENDGQSTTSTKAETENHVEQQKAIDLTLKPASSGPLASRVEVQIGLEDLLDARTIRAAARLRITDRDWVEISAKPTNGDFTKPSFGIAYARSIF